jgi:hypothetical protein
VLLFEEGVVTVGGFAAGRGILVQRGVQQGYLIGGQFVAFV